MVAGGSTLGVVFEDFRGSWLQLVSTDVLYKFAAFVLLTPISAILLRTFLAFSEGSVLSDQDILYFALKPIGWVAIIVLSAVALAVLGLEQAALMTIGYGAMRQRRVEIVGAVIHALKLGPEVVTLTARIVTRVLVVAAPFLALIGVIYLALLTGHDINYYLAEKPAEFKLALGLAAIVITALAVVLLRLGVGWVFALPIVLFESAGSRQALRDSKQRSLGHRGEIAKLLLIWLVVAVVLSSVVTGLTGGIGRLLIPSANTSIPVLVLALGFIMVLWVLGSVTANIVATVLFALLVLRLYGRWAEADSAQLPDSVSSSQHMSSSGKIITGKKLAWGVLAAAVIAAVVGAWLLNGVRTEDHTLVIAHRGASGAAPENTMAAVELAVTDNADWVEIDVQETADGEVVVIHDSDLKKVGGSDLKIWDATMADLAEIEVGSWFAPEFSDQRVPTLAEVLEACKDKSGVNIELKYYGHDDRLEERVVEIVEAHGMAEDVVVMSLKYDGVKRLHDLRPAWTVGLLTGVAVGDLTKMEVDFLAVNAPIATPSFIRSAHKSGKDVFVWTINDPVNMSTKISRGVDGLITDEPAIARKVLAIRAEMSSAERLLLELAIFLGAEVEPPSSEEDA